MGIYEQRTDGHFMVRVRVGAGLALAAQLKKIAALSSRHGNGKLHVTSRQDIQIHDVALEDTPDVFDGLLEVGLTSRGGGGNTVRNVSACPCAGRCPRERFNVSPHSIATAAYLLQRRTAFNLPRKYKIAFAGCGKDCALASVADCGFFAHKQNGEYGFKAYAGGGLGMNPRAGIVIEEFIPVGDAPLFAEAIRRVFDRHGDRINRHRARLRYVVERMGEDAFRDLCRETFAAVKAEGVTGNPPVVPDLDARFAGTTSASDDGAAGIPEALSEYAALLMPEKSPGVMTLRLPLRLGNIHADDLDAVAAIAETCGVGLVVTTQLQELLIPGVRVERLPDAFVALRATGIWEYMRIRRLQMVTCAGASTCKLGLCLSRGLANAIDARFVEENIPVDDNTPVIRISGCPNSCGGHQIGAIGLEGRAQRHNGRLVPMYGVLAGGYPSGKGAHLAELLGVVPARNVPALIADAIKNNAVAPGQLRALVTEHSRIPDDAPEEFYYDWDADQPFSLAGRGPGECGAGVLEVIQRDMREAASALKAAQQADDAETRNKKLYQALAAGTRALLPIFGIELFKDREIFAAFDRELITPGWVAQKTRSLVSAALDWKLGDNPDGLAPRMAEMETLIERLTALFASLDAHLKFRLPPLEKAEASEDTETTAAATRIDLRGVACPMNFVKAKVALEQLPVGSTLEVLLDDGAPIRNVPASFTEQEQEVVAVESRENHHLLRVRRTQ